jgi:hypothetical protein
MTSKYITRKSPPVSATKFPNKIKLGNDGNEYISKPDKNKVYKWKLIKQMDQCKDANNFYLQFPKYYLDKKFIKYNFNNTYKKLNKILNILKKENIFLLNIGWKNVYNFVDNAWYDAKKILIKKYGSKKFVKDKIKILKEKHSISKKLSDKTILEIYYLDIFNIIFYTNFTEFFSLNNGNLYLQWNLTSNIRSYVNSLFKNEFGKKYIEPKNINNAMLIKLDKI